MRTLGVDIAAQPKRTAACVIDWSDNRAAVLEVILGVDDDRLLTLAAQADKVGLDVPLGWPDQFVAAIASHHESGDWPEADTRALRFRRTDLRVWELTGKPPLSVSTDRIGVTAFRAARLLAGLGANRTGTGKFVEVYPRATRNRFELGADRSVHELTVLAPWLEIDAEAASACISSEDCFDALIASLTARASARSLCEPIPVEDRDAAEREGWIAVPLANSLSQLI